MAIVTATITVDFTAFYVGSHRVCWRLTGSGDPYDCTTIVNCPGGGTACQAIITASVNTTSCDGEVFFEGYVQAICEDVLSTQGRLPFTTSFVPNPTCLRWEFLCLYAGLSGFTIDNAGQEYLISDTVVLTRDGGDPQTVDGTATITAVGDGIINTLTGLLSGGLGYLATEVLTINGAIGAGATITIDSILPGGIIDTFTLTTNGAGYVGPLTFTGGSGAGADFDIVDGVDYDTFGSILGLTIGVVGEYEIPPTVTITTGSGKFVVLTALLLNCPNRDNAGTDCDGGDVVAISPATGGNMAVGEIFATCLATGPLSGGVQFVDTQVGCCIPADTDLGDPCTDHHMENASGGPVDVHYTACGGDNLVTTVANGVTLAVCVVVDGFVDPQVAGFTIVDTGTPCP